MLNRLTGVHAFAFAGAVLQCTEKSTGEAFVLPLDPGPIDLSPYQPLLETFDVVADAVFVHRTNTGRAMDVKSHMHMNTAAIQEFTPSSQLVQERQVRQMAAKLIAQDRKQADKDQRVAERRRERQEARRLVREAENVNNEEEVVETPVETPSDDA